MVGDASISSDREQLERIGVSIDQQDAIVVVHQVKARELRAGVFLLGQSMSR